MLKKNSNLIIQSKAARIAGVSRQAINAIKKNSLYNYFVGGKVDTEHPDWKIYLHEHGTSGKKDVDNIPQKNRKTKSGVKGKQNKVTQKSKSKVSKTSITERKNNPFTGGVDPANFIPQGTADLKRFAEIAKIKLEIEKNLGLYIDREMLLPLLDSIGRTIQSYFVNLPRKLSGRICKRLDRVGMEKIVEKMMKDPIARGIQEVKAAVIKAVKVR